MIAEILSIGDELLIGQIVNTNAAYLSKHLTRLGYEIKWVTTVGDHAGDLKQALALSMSRSEVVIATGGLGPTHDDITKTVAADFFQSKLIFRADILERLKREFSKRGIKMAAVNEEQALVPEKARVLENPLGSAPGLLFHKNGKKCFILPGVPAEMKAICEQSVFSTLADQSQKIVQKTIRTTGLPESTLFERIGDLKNIQKFVKVAFLPKAAGVDIRLTARGEILQECQTNIEKALAFFVEKIGKYVYAFDEEELEQTVAKLLLENHKTLGVAESCTGGLLSNKLTNISGSSNYFERGVIAYSNEAKMQLLRVPQDLLDKYGAVSPQVAEAMAGGVKKISGADFGLSTTGIAGPTGGTPEKPVGLVYVGLAQKERCFSKKFHFFKDRLLNKERTVQAALNLLRREILKP